MPYNEKNPSFINESELVRIVHKIKIVGCSLLGGLIIATTIITAVTR